MAQRRACRKADISADASEPLDGLGLLCVYPNMSVDGIQQHLAEAQRATQAGFREKARSHFEAVLAIDNEEPTARNWLGADALARTDAPTAAMHFEIACKREPDELSHWINLAAAHRILGDVDRERAALEKALAIDQTDLLALVRIAELHERLERREAGGRPLDCRPCALVEHQ